MGSDREPVTADSAALRSARVVTFGAEVVVDHSGDPDRTRGSPPAEPLLRASATRRVRVGPEFPAGFVAVLHACAGPEHVLCGSDAPFAGTGRSTDHAGQSAATSRISSAAHGVHFGRWADPPERRQCVQTKLAALSGSPVR